MQCLLVASAAKEVQAGFNEPVGLTYVLGMTLIHRQMKALLQAGISSLVIVTRQEENDLRSAIDKRAKRYNQQVQHIIQNDGQSLAQACLGAKEYIRQKFILANICQQLGTEAIERLAGVALPEGSVAVAIDSNKEEQRFNIQNAIRVHWADGMVRAMGSGLAEYEAYSTQTYLCQADFFETLAKAVSKTPQTTLASVMHSYLKKDMLYAVDIDNCFWIPVDNSFAVETTEHDMIAKVNQSKHDSVLTKYLFRPVSGKLTHCLLKAHFSLRPLAGVAFLTSVVAALLLSVNHYAGLFVGAFLVLMANLLIICFDEVARLKLDTALWYNWFGSVVSKYSEGLLLVGLTLHAAHNEHYGLNPIIVGGVALLGLLVLDYSSEKFKALYHRKKTPFKDEVYLARDIRYSLIFLGCILNVPFFVLLIYAVFCNIVGIKRLFTSFS